MKNNIIYTLSIALLLTSCSNIKYRVWIDEKITSKEGVLIWDVPVEFVDYEEDANVKIYYNPEKVATAQGDRVGTWIGYEKTHSKIIYMPWEGDDLWESSEIYIALINDNNIAHEFGHVLGYEHSTNFNSIMYPYCRTNKDLYSYDEFMTN